ncbi:hypothetical protein ZWY2020_059172 [Hordeum vulgare]|nr:hypothetical protein ZWY2020_059172 [Hordeum vulgare]
MYVHTHTSFQMCAYPDEAPSTQLGHELGLDTKNIRSWLQNYCTQMKALKNFVCLNPNCTNKDYFDQQEDLNRENPRLKEKLLHYATSLQDEL